MILMVAPMAGGGGVSWTTAGNLSIPGTDSADLVVSPFAHHAPAPRLHFSELCGKDWLSSIELSRVSWFRLNVGWELLPEPKLDPPTSIPQYLDVVT